MVIVIAVDESNIIKRVDIPLSDEHLQAILNNNSNLITVETDLDLGEIQLVGNYKLIDGELIELQESEKPQQELQLTELEILKQELINTQKLVVEWQFELLTNSF